MSFIFQQKLEYKTDIMEEYNVASTYQTLRKHLDSLGYKQAFSLDTLPLIEKLLTDLVKTTESLKYFKTIAQENIEAYRQLQLVVDPYKCDNSRLVRECNQLHLDLIETKEAYHKDVIAYKKRLDKLNCECTDLRSESSRHLNRIKQLEIESSKKSKKILELQGKCLKPVVTNVGQHSTKRANSSIRRPHLESAPLPKTIGSDDLSNQVSNEKLAKNFDLLKMADDSVDFLNHKVTKLKAQLSFQEDTISTLNSQLNAKEKEIIRLKKMLETDRPYSAVFKDHTCKGMEDNNAIVQENIDLEAFRALQQKKIELEQQLKEALNKQHDAMTRALYLAQRNEDLENGLSRIDTFAEDHKKEITMLQEKLDEKVQEVRVLNIELTEERMQVQKVIGELKSCRSERDKIQHTLESTLNEKKQMVDRINELTVIEKTLNDEINRLVKKNESHREDIIELQYNNRKLRDTTQGSNRSAKVSFPLSTSESNENWRKDNENITAYNNVLKRLSEKETLIISLQQTIEQLSKERDYYKEECNKLRDQRNKTTSDDGAELWIRMRQLQCELVEKEKALEELSKENAELSRKKDSLDKMLHMSMNDHRQQCPQCSACEHAGQCDCSSFSVKAILGRLERERDMARADVERLMEECDALRERIKMAAETHTSEQRLLRENLCDLETRLKHVEKERQELLLTQGMKKATISGLEGQLDDTRDELRRTKQELATQRTQYFQLRALQDQTDQALGDVQSQLSQSETELNKAMDRNKTMERQQMQFDNQVKELKQEINTLRTSMAHLDHEKDQLLMALDEKTERIAALEREVLSKEQQAIGVQQQIREIQHKYQICVDQAAEQERHGRSMQLEMENLQRQLETATYDRENAIQENRRLQDDLAALTCEVRNLQRDLEASRAESYDLKRQLQTYVSEVRRAEDLLNRKENERTEMLNHFRSLSLEATVLENNNHSLESEVAEARGALQAARDRLLDLERQLADKDCLISGYEAQISELTQNIASMETQLRQQGEQRSRAEGDLTAVRDLCVKLDQQKDVLMQQINDKDDLKSQYDMQIARLKAEQTVIQDQMNRDRATVEHLETMLDQARQESVNAQAANHELQNEMSRLKQRISELQTKLSAESAELRQYQNQAAEYSKQISELRRQVTNERFDRARKDEESRRSIKILQDKFTQDPKQISHSMTQNSHEEIKSNTHRYLQKGGNGENGLKAGCTRQKETKQADFLDKGQTTEENKCLCPQDKSTMLNKPDMEIDNDIRCVSIILHANSSMKSKCVTCVKREVTDRTISLYSKKQKDGPSDYLNNQFDQSSSEKRESCTLQDENCYAKCSQRSGHVSDRLSAARHEASTSKNEEKTASQIKDFVNETSPIVKAETSYSQSPYKMYSSKTDRLVAPVNHGKLKERLEHSTNTGFSRQKFDNHSTSHTAVPWLSPVLSDKSEKENKLFRQIQVKNIKDEENSRTKGTLTEIGCKICTSEQCKVFFTNSSLQKKNINTKETSFTEGAPSFTNNKYPTTIRNTFSQLCPCIAPVAASSPNTSKTAGQTDKFLFIKELNPKCNCKNNHKVKDPNFKPVVNKETFSCINTNTLSVNISRLNTVNCYDMHNNIEPTRLKSENSVEQSGNFTFKNKLHKDKSSNGVRSKTSKDDIGGLTKLKNTLKNGNMADYENEETNKNSKRANGEMRNQTTSTAHVEYTLTSSDLTKPEFIGMLTEIKERTKSLEEQLSMMNRSMRSKKKTGEKSSQRSAGSVTCACNKNSDDPKLHKDAIIQYPDKKNVYT